ncbi:PIG-L deacetylase family protein [Galactobacter caseinivorans]|uniref:PIG-L family deacetylase n=1 Tax=Galactobacter caseinivorans TaxID=2676123 RepID=A0A496PM62_9MICC|nr:PIG-L family deacetylase [Galactobacter caseinivorans]RKW71630.1 PIG-L family deacetylase [Galactobacter caseinivorans]
MSAEPLRQLPADVTSIVAFGAHPDDVDFGASATLARFAQAGVAVRYVVLTQGDAGGFEDAGREGIQATRAAEQRQAAEAVGALSVEVWDELDGHLAPTDALQRRVVKVLREHRPQLVLCPHPERDYERLQRSHPDHLACGEIITRAVYPALENPYAYPELQDAGLHAYKLRHLWFYGAPAARENTAVEIGGQLETKLQALMAHLSQHPDPQRMREFVAAQAQAVAANAGLPEGSFAEAFHTVEVNGPATIAGF